MTSRSKLHHPAPLLSSFRYQKPWEIGFASQFLLRAKHPGRGPAAQLNPLALSLPLSQPDSWAAAVLVDKLDARCLKCFHQHRHGGCMSAQCARLRLKPLYCRQRTLTRRWPDHVAPSAGKRVHVETLMAEPIKMLTNGSGHQFLSTVANRTKV
jgi:hypothetical protein